MTAAASKRGRRCGTLQFARTKDTLAAADQVACEFTQENRIIFLAQAVTREHPDITEAEARDLATIFVWVDA